MFEIFNYLFICKDQNFVKENIESSTNYIFPWKIQKQLIMPLTFVEFAKIL
jgi:hypothetical protein